MSQEVVRKALNALAAIGAVKREPYPPPQASPAQEGPFPTYAWGYCWQRLWPDGKGRWSHKIQATFQPQQHGRQRRQETRQLKD